MGNNDCDDPWTYPEILWAGLWTALLLWLVAILAADAVGFWQRKVS